MIVKLIYYILTSPLLLIWTWASGSKGEVESSHHTTTSSTHTPVIVSKEHSMYACDSQIFCQGGILGLVQMSRLFRDSKQFVDMPTRLPASQVISNFEKLTKKPGNLPDATIREFIINNFHPVGFDLKIVVPKDWKAGPKFLDKIRDGEMQKFGKLIHEKWKSLTRTFNRDRVCPSCATTSLVLHHPFVIPGGRFREFYYWDSFWILEGLYVSEMYQTARGIMENMIGIVEAFGFIPNGSRIYYLNRSQPPMFVQMLQRFIETCKPEREFLERAIQAADKEYTFWMEKRALEVECGDVKHVVNVYGAGLDGPRPESYPEDVLHASKLTPEQRPFFYRNVAASAESGWDFSARWFSNDSEMTSIEISNIAPLDLNSIMYRNEVLLKDFHQELGHAELSAKYQKAAKQRMNALETIFWSNESKRWGDFHLVRKKVSTEPFYISDLSPLFFQAYRPEFLAQKIYTMQNIAANTSSSKIDMSKIVETMLAPFSKILDSYPGGVPISEAISGQQWDFPNVWAPIQYWLIELYARLEHDTKDPIQRKSLHSRQLDLAVRWSHSVYCSVTQFGHVFEKYHAQLVGQPGGGGEYIVQEGFGWSNGVTLWILNKYGHELPDRAQCHKYPGDRVRPILPAPDFDMIIGK